MNTYKLMVIEIGDIRYEKLPNGNTINVYRGNCNIDCFTHYGLGIDFDKLQESCLEHYYDYMGQ